MNEKVSIRPYAWTSRGSFSRSLNKPNCHVIRIMNCDNTEELKQIAKRVRKFLRDSAVEYFSDKRKYGYRIKIWGFLTTKQQEEILKPTLGSKSFESLDNYFKLQKEIYDYFGYIEDWVAIPLDDAREYYWYLTGEQYGDAVTFAETAEQLQDVEALAFYSNVIYTQRFLPRWVYRGEDYTMICVDTHTDGNKFLQIFDNKKEVDIDTKRPIHS